jgi:hypothetical protein
MSKLLENPQIIHIIAEVAVLIGVVFYFCQKNSKLTNQINELTQRLDDQEDIIRKHEQMIIKLATTLEEYNTEQKNFFTNFNNKDDFEPQIKNKKRIRKDDFLNNKNSPIYTKEDLLNTEIPPIHNIDLPSIIIRETLFNSLQTPNKVSKVEEITEENMVVEDDRIEEEEEEEEENLDNELIEELKELDES